MSADLLTSPGKRLTLVRVEVEGEGEGEGVYLLP